MITALNYFKEISKIGVQHLPETFQKSHSLVDKVTQGGKSWKTYGNNENIKRMIILYFEKLGDYLKSKPGNETAPAEKKIAKTVSKKTAPVKTLKVPAASNPKPPESAAKTASKPMEKIDLEVQFIKRYAGLHGKVKTQAQVLSFLNGLQKAIIEKRIRKTSPYAAEIRLVQEQLVKCYNSMGSSIEITISTDTLKRFSEISTSEIQMLSVGFIKRYISLHGKSGIKDKAKKLATDIEKALEKGTLTEADPYFDKMDEIYKSLYSFVHHGNSSTLKIHESELNGLMGIIGCDCTPSLSGTGSVMSSENMSQASFQTIGLTGKWKDLIGDPAPGFTAMVHGSPKGGKSSLCLMFARYLAEHHGKVLYAAIEEGFNYTFQEKVNRFDAVHPRLFISDSLPSNLSSYDFVFIDSLTKAGMTTQDISRLKKQYPRTSFIFIVQETKGGTFRGSKEIEHEVDIIIKVTDGSVTSYGRYNQGGEMRLW